MRVVIAHGSLMYKNAWDENTEINLSYSPRMSDTKARTEERGTKHTKGCDVKVRPKHNDSRENGTQHSKKDQKQGGLT